MDNFKQFFGTTTGKIIGVLVILLVGVFVGSRFTNPVNQVASQPIVTASTQSTSTAVIGQNIEVPVASATSVKPTVHTSNAVAPKTTSVSVTQTPIPLPPSASWHTAYRYSNNTLVQTPPFSMEGSEWKITYTCTPEDSSAGVYFQGYIDSADTGAPANGGFFSDGKCQASNTSYLYAQAPGKYYLSLGSMNATYTVTVEDYY